MFGLRSFRYTNTCGDTRPLMYLKWLRDSMPEEDRKTLGCLDELSCRLPTRQIVKVFLSPHSFASMLGIMSLVEAKIGTKNVFFDMKKIAIENKKKDGSRGTKKGPIVETYPPWLQQGGRGIKRNRSANHWEYVGTSRFDHKDYGSLVVDNIDMQKNISISLYEEEAHLVGDNSPNSLMNAFLEYHSRSLVFGHQVATLLKKEIEDEEKIKMANELAELKNQMMAMKIEKEE
ncbi:hypothetical protein V8G54_026726 [Vigna mungo]|uniref:Uncharacterized protein n=1 Tax=Vigna mungo TaxID=3915 RepID=A0AAQ3N0Y3_VIGMU